MGLRQLPAAFKTASSRAWLRCLRASPESPRCKAAPQSQLESVNGFADEVSIEPAPIAEVTTKHANVSGFMRPNGAQNDPVCMRQRRRANPSRLGRAGRRCTFSRSPYGGHENTKSAAGASASVSITVAAHPHGAHARRNPSACASFAAICSGRSRGPNTAGPSTGHDASARCHPRTGQPLGRLRGWNHRTASSHGRVKMLVPSPSFFYLP